MLNCLNTVVNWLLQWNNFVTLDVCCVLISAINPPFKKKSSEESALGTDFTPTTVVFLCHYHSTSAPCSHVLPLRTLYNASNWRRPSVAHLKYGLQSCSVNYQPAGKEICRATAI